MSVSENSLRDVKAFIASGIAESAPKGERLDFVCKMLSVEIGEARSLVMRGKRLARERATINVIGDAAA
ncbi:hypothetical protein ABIA95_000198 [Bradyrhizobium sp. LA8.1]|uniref:hypothetical protein n=1 Tax=unclassified Bradyrhizobium TaxID=2631580 RepID=UPI00339988CC